MHTRQTFLRTALAAGLVAATLAGCGMMRPSNKIDIYVASLSGAQEVPPAMTQGTGSGEFMLNTNTNMLSWKVTYSGMSGAVMAGHIHGPAAMGANAGVMIPFTGNMNSQPIMGEKQLTPDQVASIASGRTYVNLHTAKYPGGEIRGQLQLRR